MHDSSILKQRLTEASRTKDLARRLSLLFATLALGVFILLVVALVDYWLVLPKSVRLAGVLLLGLVFASGAFRFASTLRKPTRLKEVALDAESQKPDTGCELSTAAEYLSGERKPAQAYEAELASALEQKAASTLQTLPYWNRPIPAALFLGACAVAVTLFGLVASGGLTAFRRAAAPWTNVPYTRVEVRPGNAEVPVGKDLDVKSVFSGRTPRDAQFSWRDPGSAQWQFATLTRNAQGEYIYPLKNVRTPVSYRVTGSDAISPEFTVEPYVPPEVKDWSVRVELPAYARRPASIQNSPNVTALRGSTVSLQIGPSTKLARAQLRFEQGAPVEFTELQNGYWSANIPISNTKYWVELEDTKGHHGGNDVSYQLAALPDEPPKVEIIDPGQDMRAEATNSVPVKVSVTDDYGLKEIKLVYHKLGGPEQYITATRNGETNSEFTAEIPLSSLPLADFELVAYHAEAADNNTLDGPGIGRSDVYFIEITNQEGGKCKSQGKAQRVNLLVIQKQIVADATALAANAGPEQFDELAKRQKDAVDFGNIYLQALTSAQGSPALAEMQAAVADMQKTQGALEKQLRAEALPPAESALAHLYQVVKLMPELKDLPTQPKQMQQLAKTNQPPILNVVLDAMKKQKPEDEQEAELAEALEEAQRLLDEQGSLNVGVQSSGSGKGSGKSESQLVRATGEAKAGQGKAQSKSKSKANKGKGKAGKNGKKGEPSKDKANKGAPGDKPQEPTEPSETQPENPQLEPQEFAQKEEQLSKEATELAEKLARLAGKGSRVGHGAGAKMNQAAGQMNAAAQAASAGNMKSAGTKGAESGASLNEAIAMIEAALKNRPARVDVSEEESPKEYETLIAEYLKKLSHQE